MDSNVGLVIQCIGILLITLLSVFMRSSIKSAALKYWTFAWASLSIALCSLFAGFHVLSAQKPLYALYFFGEYLFGLLFIAGCRNHAAAKNFGRGTYYSILAAFIVASTLPLLSTDFNDLFIVHAAIMAGMYATSLLVLHWRKIDASPGIRVMATALVFLTIDFLHYVPVFAARNGLLGITVPASYLQYTSIFDLILEIVLGFGTMMVLMESVRCELEKANAELVKARDQLQLLAQMDPLTEALNRHAFHSLLRRPENGHDADTSGCVAVLDIDNLKPINDTWGHAAGDKAIRAVARAMRSLIRADDMLFRWGGDEFLVLMFKLPEGEASKRVAKLNEILAKNCQTWTGMPISVTVSHGVAGFDSLAQLAGAIEMADKEMYAQRQRTRGLGNPNPLNPILKNLTPTAALEL
jgi:diguanylate cyclase (GGDEF)-like protein